MQQQNEDGTNFQVQTGENNINFFGGDHRHDPSETVSSGEELDNIVQKTREVIKDSLQERCGTMRVLDMPEPIKLTGENGIYTNVNILKKLTKPKTLEELLEPNPGNQVLDDRLDFGRSIERLQGLDAVETYPRLMVLGKPGAGKTTFLKYLAMQCIEGSFAADRVPFFVTLKDFAEDPESPNLVEYLAKSVSTTQEKISPVAIVTLLLQNGRSLILLDGLDEVREKHTTQIINTIRDAAYDFKQSLFVITCRIAAKEYVFQQFTEVKIADFEEQQISNFSKNWFRAKNDFPNAANFVQRLQQNSPIRNLAKNPLLLTLLCLVFGESGSFPRRRADLYEEGAKILLKKWDATRNIQRDELYRKLDVQRREDLLSSVAFETFCRGEVIFTQRRLEGYIANFLRNLKDVDPDPEMLRANSEVVLKSIEAHHGLLVERARGFYSFSHSTLQDYFTAREISITNQPTIQRDLFTKLAGVFSNQSWHEVFLLTMELLRNASDLLLEIKKELDSQLADDHKIQDFLQWVQEKSLSVSTSYKPSVVRAFYYSLALSFEYDLTLKLDGNFDHNKYPDLQLDFALNIILKRATARADLSLNLDFSETLKLLGDNELRNKLQQLNDQLPDDSSSPREIRDWKATEYGQSWVKNLRDIIVTYRHFSQDLSFTSEQRKLLRQYYNSSLFLWECLNTDCYVDRHIREYIEETLLLSAKEVEKEKSVRIDDLKSPPLSFYKFDQPK
jgi:predicted NACHT family NTPase